MPLSDLSKAFDCIDQNFLFFNWDSLHARLNSNYKACTYRKMKHKKLNHTGKLFRKNLQLIGVY